MKKIEIYEPAICCPTGVCGPAPDPELVQIQETVIKLKKEGVEIERIAINQQPQRFMSNPIIAELLKTEGNPALPVTLVDGKLFIKGRYPKYDELKNGTPDEVKKVKIKSLGCCSGRSGCC